MFEHRMLNGNWTEHIHCDDWCHILDRNTYHTQLSNWELVWLAVEPKTFHVNQSCDYFVYDAYAEHIQKVVIDTYDE